jgi:hypothetical protein
MNKLTDLRKKAKTIGTVAASAGAITAYSSGVAHAEGMLTGITLDTTTVLAGAALVVAAYGALWAINKVISIFKK